MTASVARPILWVALLVTLAATRAHAQYTITDLGTLGGTSSTATAINARGDVVGWARDAGERDRAFLVPSGGVMQDLGTLGGPTSYAYAISSLGLVVGSAADTGSGVPQRAFRWNGSMARLGDLGGPTSAAYGVNDVDDIVGSADTNPTFGNPHGFRWRAGTMTDLGTLGGQFSIAFGVSDAGIVVGTGFLAGNTSNHAFRWSGASLQDLGVIGGARSVATAVNTAGTIVGYSEIAPSLTTQRAFVRPAAASGLTSLGTLGGANSQALAINETGLIVGWAENAVGQRRAFSSTGGPLTDLNTLLPGGSGWVLQEARGVNDAGQVVGVGTHGGATRAFLLSPASLTGAPAAARGAWFAGAFPNPVRDRTHFALVQAEDGPARLVLYDVGGRAVRTLVQGALGAGRHDIAWDGRGDAGEPLPPGLYLARYQGGSGPAVTRRVSLVR